MRALYRIAKTEELNASLRPIGWGLDEYLYAVPLDDSKPVQTFQRMAPSEALSLQSFSLFAAEWIEADDRQVIVLNAPNYYDLVDEQVIGETLFSSSYSPGSLERGHILIEHPPGGSTATAHRIRLAQVIFQTFICSGHCQIFSLTKRPGRVISVQDGCLYLQNFGPQLTDEPAGLDSGSRPFWALNDQ